MAMERLTNFSDEVTKGRRSFMAEEERVEREGWVVNKERQRQRKYYNTSKHALSGDNRC